MYSKVLSAHNNSYDAPREILECLEKMMGNELLFASHGSDCYNLRWTTHAAELNIDRKCLPVMRTLHPGS